jgi:hypothetical protein
LLGLEKLAWNEILPEYDPFKYGSFAINAGELSHRLTVEIQRHIGALEKTGRIAEMPPVLAFSSVVDATVLAPALVNNLFKRLPTDDNELVLFDINSQAGVEHLLQWRPAAMTSALQGTAHPNFTLTLVTNASPYTRDVIERQWIAGEELGSGTELDLQWPEGV